MEGGEHSFALREYSEQAPGLGFAQDAWREWNRQRPDKLKVRPLSTALSKRVALLRLYADHLYPSATTESFGFFELNFYIASQCFEISK